MNWPDIIFWVSIGMMIGSYGREYFLLREIRKKGKKEGYWIYTARK